MGRSRTYHVIGHTTAEETSDGTMREYLYPAMNRLEMEQKTIQAIKDGKEIVIWWAQTRTGERILGGHGDVLARHITAPKGIIGCPRCNSEGCFVCNYSGITTKKWVSGFQAWQLEPDKPKKEAPYTMIDLP